MHLLNCLNPKRVYNKYTDEYVWVPCRECAYCRNRHAASWTAAIERERKQHRFALFVTLTYDNAHLPVLDFGNFDFDYSHWQIRLYGTDPKLVPSKGDNLHLKYSDFTLLFDEKYDKDLFDNFLANGGVPYGSSVDLQKFHKRLNKYINEKITNQFKNFRYFVCQEYGEGCFRPHFHGIYFVDDARVAERFSECVFHTWRQGRVDCQYVENSAGAYVAGYVNKSADLPSFYKKGAIRQRFYFSRFPSIGDLPKSEAEIEQIYHNAVTREMCADNRRKEQLVDVPLSKSLQNRLFPKCFSFRSVSDSTRVALYTIVDRFGAKSARDLALRIVRYCEIMPLRTEFDLLLLSYVQEFQGIFSSFYTWVKRLYYVSKRFYNNRLRFNSSIQYCYGRIIAYWNKRDYELLNKFYTFQQDYSKKDSDSLVLMYPEFCYKNFGFGTESLMSAINNFEPIDYQIQKNDSAFYEESNRKTKDKNDYIDKKIQSSENPIYYCLIKSYYNAKKRYEIGKT